MLPHVQALSFFCFQLVYLFCPLSALLAGPHTLRTLLDTLLPDFNDNNNDSFYFALAGPHTLRTLLDTLLPDFNDIVQLLEEVEKGHLWQQVLPVPPPLEFAQVSAPLYKSVQQAWALVSAPQRITRQCGTHQSASSQYTLCKSVSLSAGHYTLVQASVLC